MTPFVRVLILIFYAFAKPVSMVLDAYLGEDIGTVFTKRQLAEMIEIHENQQMIDSEERDILRGAMTFRSKTADSIMTPVDQVFMLPISFCNTSTRNYLWDCIQVQLNVPFLNYR